MKGRVKTNERFFNTRMCDILSCKSIIKIRHSEDFSPKNLYNSSPLQLGEGLKGGSYGKH